MLPAGAARFRAGGPGRRPAFPPHARGTHVEIARPEIGKNRHADVPIVGDAKDVVGALARELAQAQGERGAPDRSAWLSTLRDWVERFPYRYTQEDDGPIKPQFVVERILEATRGEATIVAGVGQHQ